MRDEGHDKQKCEHQSHDLVQAHVLQHVAEHRGGAQEGDAPKQGRD